MKKDSTIAVLFLFGFFGMFAAIGIINSMQKDKVTK